jgi:hypothetical protein
VLRLIESSDGVDYFLCSVGMSVGRVRFIVSRRLFGYATFGVFAPLFRDFVSSGYAFFDGLCLDGVQRTVRRLPKLCAISLCVAFGLKLADAGAEAIVVGTNAVTRLALCVEQAD